MAGGRSRGQKYEATEAQSQSKCTHRLCSRIPTIRKQNNHVLYVWSTALRLVGHLVFKIRHECAINVYWNAHLCLHYFQTCQLSFHAFHLSFNAFHLSINAFHLSFHACKRVVYWSKEWGKGSGESICDRRENHELQCIWDVVFKGIIEGLGHIVIDRLVESWGKVLHSIGYSTDEAYQDRCLTHSTVLNIYQRCILDSTSQVFLIGLLIGW